MCAEYYQWRKRSYFLNSRPLNCPAELEPDSGWYHDYSIQSLKTGERCCFTDRCAHTAFLDREISEGIYSWTVQPELTYTMRSHDLMIGIASLDLLKVWERRWLGLTAGSCSLSLRKSESERNYSSKLEGVEGWHNAPEREGPSVACWSLVTIEFDYKTHTLVYFVDGKRIVPAISGVPSPFLFGVSGIGCPHFLSLSFRRLPSPTTSCAVCKFSRCRTKDDQM